MNKPTHPNDPLRVEDAGDNSPVNCFPFRDPDTGTVVDSPRWPFPKSPAPKRKYVLQGGELRSKLAEYMQLVDELENAMTSLPHVQDDGGSECPFAGELYAKKEELEAKVIDAVKNMHSFLTDLHGELQRQKANLGRIASDAGRLRLQETQDTYDTAEAEQSKVCRRIIQDLDAIAVALGKAEAVLKISRQRKHPGGKLRQEGSPAGPGSRPPVSPDSQESPGGLGRETRDLFPLGPLGQGPRSK